MEKKSDIDLDKLANLKCNLYKHDFKKFIKTSYQNKISI